MSPLTPRFFSLPPGGCAADRDGALGSVLASVQGREGATARVYDELSRALHAQLRGAQGKPDARLEAASGCVTGA